MSLWTPEKACEANLGVYFQTLCRPPSEFHRGRLTWYLSGVPYSQFNGACLSRLNQADAERSVPELIRRFRASKVPLRWWVGPSSTPKNLGGILTKNSLTLEHDEPGMALDMTELAPEPTPPGMSIEIVSDSHMMDQWIRIACSVFGITSKAAAGTRRLFDVLGGGSSSMVHYLGFWNGRAVATSSVVYGARAAGIYDVAVSPRARGKGVGRAVTLKPLLDAKSKGYKVGVLQSSEMAHGVYIRLGFKDCCKFALYEADFST